MNRENKNQELRQKKYNKLQQLYKETNNRKYLQDMIDLSREVYCGEQMNRENKNQEIEATDNYKEIWNITSKIPLFLKYNFRKQLYIQYCELNY